MHETIIETKVTYTLQHAGKFFIIEHVPARVCKEQAIIQRARWPDKVIETLVYEYASKECNPTKRRHLSGMAMLRSARPEMNRLDDGACSQGQ